MTSNPADVQDIVERLRRASSALLGHYPVGAIERIPADTMTEAADEIERLRAALQQSRSAVDALREVKKLISDEEPIEGLYYVKPWSRLTLY